MIIINDGAIVWEGVVGMVIGGGGGGGAEKFTNPKTHPSACSKCAKDRVTGMPGCLAPQI